jgi:hypothetical protein
MIAMILIGQFDSPFVRRVGVALTLYGLPFEHRPWSVWANADALAQINPLRRVPTLILDDGEVLIESSAILDALDEIAGPQLAMLPRSGAERRRGLKVCALATGLGDKAVSLFYESLLHEAPSQAWIDRCRAQIADVLTALELLHLGILARRIDRPRRHRRRLRLALHPRGAPRPVRRGALATAGRARRCLRGSPSVPGGLPAAHRDDEG